MIDVAVVGAGRAGLWLAAELRLAGVRVVVFEQAVQGLTTATVGPSMVPRRAHIQGKLGQGTEALDFRGQETRMSDGCHRFVGSWFNFSDLSFLLSGTRCPPFG
jgi:2-polyprenyl-6-methoxyphenol hydroxylase-like FAD-dependent oxidoreductase